MKFKIKTKCPYCAQPNLHEFETGFRKSGDEIVYCCDKHESSCDEQFVIHWNIEIKHELSMLELVKND